MVYKMLILNKPPSIKVAVPALVTDLYPEPRYHKALTQRGYHWCRDCSAERQLLHYMYVTFSVSSTQITSRRVRPDLICGHTFIARQFV